MKDKKQNKAEKQNIGHPNQTKQKENNNSSQSKNSQAQGLQGSKNEPTPQVTRPSVNLPKGGGAIQGIGEKFEANPTNGTFNMSVPLPISPGRGGFSPQLGLSYNSGGGNSPFGLGWGVGIPNITRKTDKGLPKYYDGDNIPEKDADTFILSGAEDLVPVDKDPTTEGEYTVKEYRPRTEGLFARIERLRNSATGRIFWRTISKDNITSIYGESQDACIANPEGEDKIFSWYLERSYDAKGNVMLFEYKREDILGITVTANESHRLDDINNLKAFNQIYLDKVKYGNLEMYSEGVDLSASKWMFQLVFDYGNYNTFSIEGDKIIEDSVWQARQDAFSSYKSGFEIRTYRRCQSVLMFHYFPELGENAVLTKTTVLEYEENPYFSLLTKATQCSYGKTENRTNQDDIYVEDAFDDMPPMEFTYSKAEIGTQLHQVDPTQLENLPAGVDGSTWQFMDLYGEGLSGVLRTENNAWYYKHNLGDKSIYSDQTESSTPNLQLGGMQVLKEIPSVQNSNGTSFYLGDVDSDSQPEVIFEGAGGSGYFSLEDGQWQNFQSFRSIPNIDKQDPNLKRLDLTGDGLADMLISRGDYFEMYFSAGKEGYNDYRRVQAEDTEDQGPVVLFADPKQSIYLADMVGDGLSDIVKITHNSVCYWPNLGYGRFGQKVMMKNTPLFDSPDIFNPSRIKLADVDSTGTTDIIYFGASATTYYKNQSGNGWSNKIEIDNFPLFDSMSQVHVTDLFGNGTSCLVWSSPLPAQEHNFKFIELTSGIKPYMLTSFENNMGRKVNLSYAPSTKFYLQDKAKGKPWITRLPFPVQVLEKVEDHEQVSDVKFVNRYAYHHGHYDTAEREFRGFGMVEQWDSEVISDDKPEGYQHPTYTKKWFHTGFHKNRESISLQYTQEYFQGDDKAWQLDDTIIPNDLTAQEEREACRALRGQMLRSEVYAQDGSDKEDIPYLVEEKNMQVKMHQAVANNKHGVFSIIDREAISYHYERNVQDPRIQHVLTLETDEYNNVLKSAQVAYPRRSVEGEDYFEEQSSTKIIISQIDVINKTSNSVRLIGIPYQAKSFELTGVSVFSDGKYDLDNLKSEFISATEIDFEDKPILGLHKRCFQHQKTVFYKGDLTGKLELGEVAPHALPYQNYKADITEGLLTDLNLSHPGFTETKLKSAELGYYYEKEGNKPGVYFIPSDIIKYDADNFYTPKSAIDPFGNTSTFTFDAYGLFMTEATDAMGYITCSEHDYRVLQPCKITDPNGNVQELSFTTLGMIKAQVVRSGDGSIGDTLLSPTIKYAYNLTNWKLQTKPVYVKLETRVTHADADTDWMTSYVYTGGLGNEVMTKVQAEAGLVNGVQCDRWVGTGRTVVNNKGNVIKQYEPFFSDTYEFEDEDEVVENGVTPFFYYDPIGRNIRTDFPDDTFTKVEFTPWLQKIYDQNDTMLESNWYINAQSGSTALQTAATVSIPHADTPQIKHFDNLGREFQTDDDNNVINDNDEKVFYSVHNTLDIAGRPVKVTDAKCRVMTSITMGMMQSFSTHNIDSGTRWVLNDVAGKPIYSWDSRGHEIQHSYDALQRPTEIRLKIGNDEKIVEKTEYGTDASKNNIGQVYKQYDQSGVTEIVEYDFKGNPLQTTKRFTETYNDAIDWANDVTLLDEEFTHSFEYDALNRPTKKTLPNAVEETYTYNKAGLLEAVNNGGEDYVTNINYNEKGQRTEIFYGNNTKTQYTYDPKTFRLTRLLTTRTSDSAKLQDLNYTYDPVGNITEIENLSQKNHYFSNSVITPKSTYQYDALYRLTLATGREKASLQKPVSTGFMNYIPNPNTANNAMQEYHQTYKYDALGNMLELKNAGGTPWTRNFNYNTHNNYLLGHTGTNEYTYDAHGNITKMPHLNSMNWDYKDQLTGITKGANGETTAYYTYNFEGERVRKVVVKGNIKEARFYLGDYEHFTKTTSGAVNFTRESVHISDDKKRIVLIERKDQDAPVIRYQYDDHLGSASLELNQEAQIITYEEYHPFGTTSYRSGKTETEASLKRYKYVGKERDEESGLYYYGARYYAAWICRFVSVDPLQFDYPYYTPFQYAGNKPIIAIDLDGLESQNVVQDEEIGQQGFWYTRGEFGLWKKSDAVGPLSEEYRLKHGLYSFDETVEIKFADLLEYLIPNDNDGIVQVKDNKINDKSIGTWDSDEYFKSTFLPTLFKHEGGYQNCKSDNGNWVDGELIGTNHGISAPVLKAYLGHTPTVSEMKNLTKNDAAKIYKKNYWEKPKVGQIKDKFVAEQYADMYVNAGGSSVKIMQRALNNLGGNLAVDGAIGKKTLAAINNADPKKLHAEFKNERIKFYNNLHAKNPTKYGKWIGGWIKRANSFKYGSN